MDEARSRLSQDEQPFRFMDLPPEIRNMILELLLVQGTVSASSDKALDFRFWPYFEWNHRRPQWSLLSAVSRQMQAEAANIVYSPKNIFVAPLGPFQTWGPRAEQVFLFKRIDISFDMRDGLHDTVSMTEILISESGGFPFHPSEILKAFPEHRNRHTYINV